MKVLRFNILPFVLLGLLASAQAQPAAAQDAPQGPRRGGGFMAMENSVHGTVTAISGGEFTVKNEEGESYKIATGPNTHFMKDRQPIKPTDIHVGDTVITGGDTDEKAHTVGAVFLAVLDAEQVQRLKQARADFGKTWTAGKITAINDLKITIERPDKVTQTVAVDENTSFRKHRDSITLADIKVGDTITARGALANNAFLASQLSVVEPGQRGFRNGSGPGGNPNGAQPQ
jgi:Domain of unknown function (DUF5666)